MGKANLLPILAVFTCLYAPFRGCFFYGGSMKKRFLLIAALALIAVLSLSLLAACGEEEEGEAECVIIFADSENNIVAEYKLTTTQKHLEGALRELDEKEASLAITNNSGYIEGFACNGTVYGSAARNEYALLFCDDEQYTNPVWDTIELNGKTYASAAVGAADLPVKNGGTYVIAIRAF